MDNEYGWMDGEHTWMNGWMRWMDGWMRWMDGWTDGEHVSMYGWVDVRSHFWLSHSWKHGTVLFKVGITVRGLPAAEP